MEVKELKVVKIAQGKESTQLNYLDATSNLWNGTEDSDGNKVYTLQLSEHSFNEEKKINTYEISIRPYEDCCTIFKPKRPKTKPRLDECLKYEEKFDYKSLIQDAVDNLETIYISSKD